MIFGTAIALLTSFYGPGFHGNLTANGEIFNQQAATAAHKTLPFGTQLKVCYKACETVRINDRGPFIGGRQLDISLGTAVRIGLYNRGVDYTTVTRLS